jgi:hypothetical protein
MDIRHRLLTVALWSSVGMLSAAAYAQQGAPDPRAPAAQADNTRVNERDKNHETLTAFNQSNNPADLKLAAAVRKAIVDDKSLSTSAHNVKLIAMNGAVTLRGPVKSDSERTRVAQIAANVSGVSNVDNQLDVKSP